MKHTFKHNSFTILLLLTMSLSVSVAQTAESKHNVVVHCIAFYNLENLFDTIDNANLDEEFLPNGAMKWGTMKYQAKLRNMSQAISKIGSEIASPGAVILGVSEIENRGVLEDLVKQPSIAKRNYQIVHYESPDRRGIDVGLLYNPKYFIVTNSKCYTLHSADTSFRTRDQLLVSGYLANEKIHIIVNHWPSRTGGEERSRPRRNEAAALTKSISDSLLAADPKAKIIIMGDLNDDPFNESCSKILGAKKDSGKLKPGELYNTLWKTLDRGIGSLAYADQWNLFDQIIISEALAKSDVQNLRFWKAEVFNKPFLTQQEGRYKGTPLRTHAGGVWLNGYSDHFPTLIYLVKEIK